LVPLALLTAVLAGCDAPARGGAPRADAPAAPAEPRPDAPIRVEYVCANRFLVINAHPYGVEVGWQVDGADERGRVSLPPAPSQDPAFSETEVVTANRGTLVVLLDGRPVQARENDGLPCEAEASAPAFAGADASSAGQWGAPFSSRIVAVHLSLLPNGKVLSWGKFGEPQVWNPATGGFAEVPAGSWLFCAGHSFLPDGRLLVAGGHLADDRGIADANIFDPRTQTWARTGSMARGRCYPTNTTLADGSVVTIAGRDEGSVTVGRPEVWRGGTWRPLTGASLNLPYYPRTFLAPNGRVFYAGEQQTTRYLNTVGSGSWTTVAQRKFANREYGAAVMYEPGKILYAGGGRTTRTAEVIDLNRAAPAWQFTAPMAYARRHLNATLLPDGTVLVTGGTSGTGFSDPSLAVHAAELWDPATGAWRTLASNAVNRVYHATSLLLPDGRVLHSGSGDAAGQPDQRTAELFSPPYLFNGARPRVSSAPSSVGYGQSFSVGSADAAGVQQVTWLALGSVTHAFDANQRFLRLAFSRTATGVNVTAPASRNLAPPGYYMLFLLNASGVPSVGRFIRLR